MKILTVKEFNTINNTQILKGFSSLSNFDNFVILPGFCDVHVHFREPGFEYKETIETGVNSAINGGYSTVFTMPNLKPVPDSLENLNLQLNAIKNVGKIEVIPYGSITKGQMGEELSQMDKISPYVCAFTDDGRGVQSESVMESAMKKAKELDKIIVAHCEDNSLLNGGYIHDGEYAKLNGHKGISSASEYKQVIRDIELVKKLKIKYHVCHVSTLESVDAIRQAKKDGVDITCETAPHYLVFNDMNLIDGGRFKMNPPIRSEKDRLALIEGIKDGTIDMIATDHAPHSKEEKSKGLKGSLNGIVGLETSFSVLFTNLVKSGIITLEKLVELMAVNPRKRFNLPFNEVYSVWNLDEEYIINVNDFKSKGKSSPFEDMRVFAKRIATFTKTEILG